MPLSPKKRTASSLPPWPEPDADGYVPAMEFVRVSIARDIIRERKALGLTQEQLAKLAGVRQETLCRLETGRHSPTVRTVEKIDKALVRAARSKRRSTRAQRAVGRARGAL
jgi:DNA-binding XRE family transcriptional regulator